MLDSILKPIDKLINKVSMYRLLLYYLVGLLLIAILFSASGIMHYSGLDIAISSSVLVFACWAVNKVLASIFRAPLNPESSILTGLILALIVPSKPTGFGLLFLLAVSGLAMASKYIISYRGKHIFNPAAIGVFLTAIGPHQSASWWVATSSMMPFVVLGGILVVRKVRRESMVFSFLITTTVVTLIYAITSGASAATNLKNMVLNSAVFFLGFVMLTEPLTQPDTKFKRIVYGAIVGAVMAPQFHIGHVYTTPEAALVIGNLFAFIFSNKIKLFPVLVRKYAIAADSGEFVYAPEYKISYQPGQYMEFTLPHENTDSRGSRRFFTLASSPTESDIRLGVRFYQDSSSYKHALINSKPGESIVASGLSGDFIMPRDRQRKLVFIAGGIGITPFRSMIKYLIDKREQRDIILIYGDKDVDHLAYRELLELARDRLGVQIYYVLSGSNRKSEQLDYAVHGRINGALIKKLVEDFNERTFYISGPLAMTEDIKRDLSDLGITRANIKVDFFSGYA